MKAAPHASSKKAAKDDLVDLTTDQSKICCPQLYLPHWQQKKQEARGGGKNHY
jgi:hypothetical protein